MRVLHFFKTAFPDTVGGIEQTIHHLAAGTVRCGWDVDVLSLAAGDAAGTRLPDGYTLHRARRDGELASTGFSWSALRKFASLAAEADIVHYHFPWPFMDLAHFAMRMKTPSVVTYHSDIIRQKHLLALYRPLQSAFLRSVDRIVATSPNYLCTSPVLAGLRQKCEVIPIGVDRQLYPEPGEARLDHWRERVGDRFFLFIGVLRYYKGLHILLEAAQQARYPVVIAGAGPIEAHLRIQAKQLGLRNVHFLGHISEEDKACLLTLSYGAVFPSHLRSEAFGISLLEGAMFGKPMISSEIGTGTTYINIAGETGLVVPPGDPAALAQAMTWLWNNPGQASRMGATARERYLTYFTCEKMSDAYINLYHNIIDARNHKNVEWCH
jgi:rhamnosyl/mannosyltransferase